MDYEKLSQEFYQNEDKEGIIFLAFFIDNYNIVSNIFLFAFYANEFFVLRGSERNHCSHKK